MRYLLAVVAVLGLTACSSPIAPNPSSPTIRSFTSDRTMITAGQTATLSWRTVNGDVTTLHSWPIGGEFEKPVLLRQTTDRGNDAIDTMNVSPSQSMVYTLTVRNRNGAVSRDVIVEVGP